MKTIKSKLHLMPWLLFLLTLLLVTSDAHAHVKWFINFDVSDRPQNLLTHPAQRFIPILLIISLWGVLVFGFIDAMVNRHISGYLSLENRINFNQNDLGLTIARIGTGILFIALWLIGDVLLEPELYYASNAHTWVATLQLLIAISTLFRPLLVFTGVGIWVLYAYTIATYGLFHALDYTSLVGLGAFLFLSGLPKRYQTQLGNLRYVLLYTGLIFAFLWSAIEKIAYPQVFYRFLEQYPFLTMGMDQDFFITTAALVEFTLFFLLLFSGNGIILLAFAANLLVTVGNIFFGKIDAIGHWPVNFMLLMMLVHGPLPITLPFLCQKPCTTWLNLDNVARFLLALMTFIVAYYGLHYILYSANYR